MALDRAPTARRPRRSRSRPDTACPGRGSRTAPSFVRSRLEDVDEGRADDLSLLLGIGDARQPIEEQRRTRPRSRAAVAAARTASGPAPPRSAAAGRCRRRCTSAGRRWRDARAAPRRSSRRRRTGRSTTRPSPTCARIRADRLLDERRHRPVAGAAADAVTRSCGECRAALGVHDFGMEQQRRRGSALGVCHRRDRRVGARRGNRESGGAAATKSPWLAQTLSSPGTASNSGRAVRRR